LQGTGEDEEMDESAAPELSAEKEIELLSAVGVFEGVELKPTKGTSCNYMLIDSSRPGVAGIFYVGVACKSLRPYDHLGEAAGTRPLLVADPNFPVSAGR